MKTAAEALELTKWARTEGQLSNTLQLIQDAATIGRTYVSTPVLGDYTVDKLLQFGYKVDKWEEFKMQITWGE